MYNFLAFYRSSDVATRKKYANLVDSVKDSGGTALIFSSMHVSGEREYIHYFLLIFPFPPSIYIPAF